MKKIRWKTLLIAAAIPLLVGGLSALLTMGNMELFELVEKPSLISRVGVPPPPQPHNKIKQSAKQQQRIFFPII